MKGYLVALALCVAHFLGADGLKRGSEGQSREMMVPGGPPRVYEGGKEASSGFSQAQAFDGFITITTPARKFVVQFKRGSPISFQDREAFVRAIKRVQPGQRVVFSVENGDSVTFKKNGLGEWIPSFEDEGPSERMSGTDVLIAIVCLLLLTATWG